MSISLKGTKSDREVANEKSKRIMEGVALWAAFYRSNPHRFAKDYLNVNLKLFQKILLYAMMLNNAFMYVAARGRNAMAFPVRNIGVIKVGEIGEG